jgi:hypothetical protein
MQKISLAPTRRQRQNALIYFAAFAAKLLLCFISQGATAAALLSVALF